LASLPGFVFTRLGKVDGNPVLVEHLNVSQAVFPDFDQLLLEGQSLSRLVEQRYQRRPIGGQQMLSVATLTSTEANLLEVEPGHAALLVERRLDFSGASGAIFARLLVLTHRVTLTQTLTEPSGLSAMPLSLEKTR
jgi:DNA-binding GntR family transcriptional regulator